MTAGTEALASAYAKLCWAESRHDQMRETFAAFAETEDEDARPYGIKFRALERPAGLIIATFIVEKAMPEEISLLAADVVHNTRVALDHTLARLKEHFGGNPGRGSFPICSTEDEWRERVVEAGGQRSPVVGLDQTAVDFISSVQPLHRPDPENDPLVVLNRLDNADKHQLLQTSFIYPAETAKTGLDLITEARPSRVVGRTNSWSAGEPLEDGTQLATFMVRNPEEGILRVRKDQPIGYAIGKLNAGRTDFTAMIERVREIADGAASLIDAALAQQA
jgi:hypothetical protein